MPKILDSENSTGASHVAIGAYILGPFSTAFPKAGEEVKHLVLHPGLEDTSIPTTQYSIVLVIQHPANCSKTRRYKPGKYPGKARRELSGAVHLEYCFSSLPLASSSERWT